MPGTGLAKIPVLLLSLGWLAACSSPAPPPATYGPGSVLPSAQLEDQFGALHPLDESLRLVLFSRDMEGGAILREVLAVHPDVLARLQAVYVADISGMPGLIASMRAIPRMRDRPYPTLLDRDGTVTAAFPSEPGKATLLRLERRQIQAVSFLDSASQLRDALGIPAGG